MDEKVYDYLIKTIRVEPDVFKKAELIFELYRKHGVKLKIVAKGLGCDPSYISHILRLRRLPNLIKDAYYSHTLTATHLFILARIPESNAMIRAFENVLEEGLTAKQTEELVRWHMHSIKPSDTQDFIPQIHIEKWVDRAKRKYNAKVQVLQTRIKGKITLEVKGNAEETSRLLKRIMHTLTKDKRLRVHQVNDLHAQAQYTPLSKNLQ